MTASGTATMLVPTRPRVPVPSSARAVLTVDLNALRANWARLNQSSGRAECAGVIKADALLALELARACGKLRDRKPAALVDEQRD